MTHRCIGKPFAVISLLLLSAFLLVVFAGCGSETAGTDAFPATTTPGADGTTASSTASPQELTVSAASSLKAAFTDLGAAFDSAHHATTTFNFDASGTLQKQIEGGAPVDVFASAATKQMKALQEAELVDEATVNTFAGNEIVILVPADSALGIDSFEDLAGSDVRRITYGDPTAAPHGVAAEEILATLGLFEAVKPKVIYAANVSGALEYVSRGEVDAAIVFATEAKIGGDRVKVAATSQPEWHKPIVYPLAVVSASGRKPLAQAFVDFVLSPEGQDILQSHGFLPAG